MTQVTAELFCDPYAAACWERRPALRHVEYKFPAVEWVVRPVVARAESLDGTAAEEYAADAKRAGTTAGLPVAEDALAEGVPDSWAACEALVAVRDADSGGALELYHRLTARAFAAGRPTSSPDELAALATSVADVERETVRDAVGSRRATATVGADLEIGRQLVATLPETEVRGDPATMPLAPRAFGGIPPGNEAGDRPECEEEGQADSDGEDSAEDAADRDSAPAVPAPPLVRLSAGESTVVVDPSKGQAEFADVLRTFDPDMGETDYSSKIHARDAMRSYGISKRMAENISSEEYRPKVERVLTRLGGAFLTEIATCTDLDPETCRRTLRKLRSEGTVARTDAGVWRHVRE